MHTTLYWACNYLSILMVQATIGNWVRRNEFQINSNQTTTVSFNATLENIVCEMGDISGVSDTLITAPVPSTKWPPFWQTTILNAFFNENDRIPIQICSQESNWQYASIGWGKGLVLKRRQVITWTNADLVHWRIYVTLGGDELNSACWCNRAWSESTQCWQHPPDSGTWAHGLKSWANQLFIQRHIQGYNKENWPFVSGN